MWLLCAALSFAECGMMPSSDVARVANSASDAVSLVQSSLPTTVRRQGAGVLETSASKNASRALVVAALESSLSANNSKSSPTLRAAVLATGASSLSSAAVVKAASEAPPANVTLSEVLRNASSQRSFVTEATVIFFLLAFFLGVVVLAVLWYFGAALGLYCSGRDDSAREDTALLAAATVVMAGSAAVGVVGYMCWRWHVMRALAAAALVAGLAVYALVQQGRGASPRAPDTSEQGPLGSSAAGQQQRAVARTRGGSSPWLFSICAGGCVPRRGSEPTGRDKGKRADGVSAGQPSRNGKEMVDNSRL